MTAASHPVKGVPAMTNEHFQALLSVAGAKPDAEGWSKSEDERLVTLHSSNQGVGLVINRIVAVRLQGELVLARTDKGDQFVVALRDVFAASVEAPKTKTRQAGFR